MAGRGTGPDFVEALARGLDVLACFGADRPAMSLTEVATASDLARPTARRLLLTLEELGFVRSSGGAFQLTPKVLSLGMAYIGALGLWDIARPHLETLVAQTGESSSMAQLDGSDIVYVARVAVPKLITLRVEIGTRFPAAQTSQGKVLLAALSPTELHDALATPSRAGLPPYIGRTPDQLDGADIVYVARVAVPKLITLRVEIGTRFPAVQTSQGKVLLAGLTPEELKATLAEPSRAGLPPYIGRTPEQLTAELTEARARGWALADEELAPGIRSVAVPVRDGTGTVRAAMNVTVHAAETTTERLLADHLPRLLRTAGDISAEWALWQSRPQVQVARVIDAVPTRS